jgi:hypothetical protein
VAANFYELFRAVHKARSISPLRDLYSAKDIYISLAFTKGVTLSWLWEQTGVAMATVLKHYGRFIHSSEADDFEMSKIEADSVQFRHRGRRAAGQKKDPSKYGDLLASPTGFEPGRNRRKP